MKSGDIRASQTSTGRQTFKKVVQPVHKNILTVLGEVVVIFQRRAVISRVLLTQLIVCICGSVPSDRR
jgi:hypothetical protein